MLRSFCLLAFAGVVFAAGPQRVPLFFIGNHGQAPDAVRYMAQGPELTAWFSDREIRFRLGSETLAMSLEGASERARIEAIERLPGQVNFLVGTRDEWRTGLA